jgi:4-amino-4-deoxy-L-arabinose transferase-like glycosyltransferase
MRDVLPLNISPKFVSTAAPFAHSLTLTRTAAFVLLAIFVCLGLIGHDPWKQDEAYAFGIVYSMLKYGDWVVPTLAGEPFMEKPPLVYLLAALTAKLTSTFLPLHEGARLASGVLSAITIAATAMSARAIFGNDNGSGRIAALVLVACLGFVMHARVLLTDLGVIAGVAIALYGFVTIFSRRDSVAPTVLIGTGAGIAFLSKGLVGIAVLGATALVLPMQFKQWRSRRYATILAIAFVAALPWLVVWPVALYLRSPALFYDWFWVNNVGRFLGFAVPALGAKNENALVWQTMLWFTFPALPLIAWAWWKKALDWRTMPGVQLGFTFVALYMLMLTVSASGRDNYFLPLLPAVAMLAVPALRVLPRWINHIGGVASLALFAAAATFVWVVWLIAVQTGTPPDWPLLTKHLPPDFKFSLVIPICLLAIFLTYSLLSIIVTQWRTPTFLLSAWCGGILIFGVAVSMLLMPWLDAAKSYRQPFTAMRAHLPVDAKCLSVHHVGESERGVLHYFMDQVPTRHDVTHATNASRCPFVLAQGFQHDTSVLNDIAYERVLWTGARQGDKREQFWLLDLRTDLNLAQSIGSINKEVKPDYWQASRGKMP